MGSVHLDLPKGACLASSTCDAAGVPSDFIIKTGDMIKITIPPPVLVPAIQAPVPLKGTSTDVQVNNQFVCLQGDELPMSLRGPLPTPRRLSSRRAPAR